MNDIKITKILIVDDHAHAREAIREQLSEYKDFLIIGEAQNGEEAIFLADELNPDLILMDINMPGIDGLKTTKLIKEQHPNIIIVILTVSEDSTHLFEALKQGAQGFLIKKVNPGDWYPYLKSVVSDNIPVSYEFVNEVLQTMSSHPKKNTSTIPNPLSQREMEILKLVAKGYTNKEISNISFISENTVKNHLKNITKKLGIKNRVHLTRHAIENGWIEP
ncbi:response regulator [Bacillus marasmi]|uniref:response regulator n=1 Tax=Bacillus marasmi TaxID=1926279 RepID=UPI0011CB598E|nr:response regulator transcription factor [Bacillus marasmi]